MGDVKGFVKKILKHNQEETEIRSMGKMQEMDLSLNKRDVEDLLNTRSGVREQLVEMASKFGLSEADIDKERWRALEVVHACNHCSHSKHCFQYLTGNSTTGFGRSDCPNAGRYEELSRSK